MPETKKPSTKKKEAANSCIWLRYKQLCSWEGQGPTANYLERLALELMEWADKPESMRIVDFVHERGVPYNTLLYWSKKYKEFGIAYRYALDALGSRRENAAIRNEGNPLTLHYTMRHYFQAWDQEELNKLTREAAVKLAVEKAIKENRNTITQEDLTQCIMEVKVKNWPEYGNDSRTETEDAKVSGISLSTPDNQSD